MPTLFQKARLLQGLVTGDTTKTDPTFITLDITSRCNIKCIGCPYHSPYMSDLPSNNPTLKDISFNFVKKLCSELKPTKTKNIVVEGLGEPFMHPAILDIISIIKSNGFDLTILTNGTLLDENTIMSLIDLRVNTISISLWASSEEEYKQNYFRAPSDNLEKVIHVLKTFACLKAERRSQFPIIRVHNPITHYNYQSIGDMVDLVVKTKANGLTFSPFVNLSTESDSVTLSKEEEISLCLDLEHNRKRLNTLSLYHNIDTTLLRYRIGEKVWEQAPCYTPWYHARIRPDGRVYPCCRCELELGNLVESSFQDIWNAPAYHAFRQQTITREGVLALNDKCDCRFCFHLPDNLRIHQIFKWFYPFSKMKR